MPCTGHPKGDEHGCAGYYTVRIAMAHFENARLGADKLVPGMLVEVFIKTGDRPVLSHLIKPLADQAQRAFMKVKSEKDRIG